MKPNADDISIADESQDVFDDDLFDEWLDKSGRAVFKKYQVESPFEPKR